MENNENVTLDDVQKTLEAFGVNERGGSRFIAVDRKLSHLCISETEDGKGMRATMNGGPDILTFMLLELISDEYEKGNYKRAEMITVSLELAAGMARERARVIRGGCTDQDQIDEALKVYSEKFYEEYKQRREAESRD